MNTNVAFATNALNQRFMTDYPLDAARTLEAMPAADAAQALVGQRANILAPVLRLIIPERSAAIIHALPDELSDQLLAALPASYAIRLLNHLEVEEQASRIARLSPANKQEIETLLSHPPDTAGRIMNTRISVYRPGATVGETLNRLRKKGMKTARSLFLVDDDQRLTGKVDLQEMALSPAKTKLAALQHPLVATVRATDSLGEVTRILESGKILDLAVVDLDGIFLGAITHDDLARTVQADATADIQTMVGAGKEERALSSPFFTVRKRMPWLQVNLLTAFMAAAVVGFFEGTIAQVTALAVLLPVVAGQSGNTGAQALAVTMRGLALREVTIRQWVRVTRKEAIAGFLNGIPVALTCGLGIYLWSSSPALVVVIMSSMVLAMTAAGLAGAVIPMTLTRFGQDPATSSSIILTTVTDITGFFAFLGIATMMIQFL